MRVHQVHTVAALSASTVPLIRTSTLTALQRVDLVPVEHTPVTRPLVASLSAQVRRYHALRIGYNMVYS